MASKQTQVFGPGERLVRKAQVVVACATAEPDDRTTWRVVGKVLVVGVVAAAAMLWWRI